MCIDDDDEAIEEFEELYTIIPVIDTDDSDDEERQYEDLDVSGNTIYSNRVTRRRNI